MLLRSVFLISNRPLLMNEIRGTNLAQLRRAGTRIRTSVRLGDIRHLRILSRRGIKQDIRRPLLARLIRRISALSQINQPRTAHLLFLPLLLLHIPAYHFRRALRALLQHMPMSYSRPLLLHTRNLRMSQRLLRIPQQCRLRLPLLVSPWRRRCASRRCGQRGLQYLLFQTVCHGTLGGVIKDESAVFLRGGLPRTRVCGGETLVDVQGAEGEAGEGGLGGGLHCGVWWEMGESWEGVSGVKDLEDSACIVPFPTR